MPSSPLKAGYHALPIGHLANVVTCLEMTARPEIGPISLEGHSLQRLGSKDIARFRALFSDVGRDIMWFSRLLLDDAALGAILGDRQVHSLALMRDGADIGIAELDFRKDGECELSFFGLVPDAIGKGTGRWLMNEALTRAWAQPISRLWVHTCNFDHPAALGFYQRSGFKPYQMLVEVHPDPRLSGHMPRDASPQVPLIEA